jgi:hypothetical protein
VSSKAEPLQFVKHTDPKKPSVTWITVDRWTHKTLLAPEVVDFKTPGGVVRLEGTVRFKVSNGDAEYRIVGWNHAAQALELELVAWTGPT